MKKSFPGRWVSRVILLSGIVLSSWYCNVYHNANLLFNTLATLTIHTPPEVTKQLPLTAQDITFGYTDAVEARWLRELKPQSRTTTINPLGPLPCTTGHPQVQTILDAAQLNRTLDGATPAQLEQAREQLEKWWKNKTASIHWLPTLTLAILHAHNENYTKAKAILKYFFSIKWNKNNIDTLLAVNGNDFDGQKVAIAGFWELATEQHLQIFTRILYIQGTIALHLHDLKKAATILQNAVDMSRILLRRNHGDDVITFSGCTAAANGELKTADIFNNLLAAYENVAALPQNIIDDLQTINDQIQINPPPAVIETLIGSLLSQKQDIPHALLEKLSRDKQVLIRTIQTARMIRSNQRNLDNIIQLVYRGDADVSALFPDDTVQASDWLSAVRKDIATRLTNLANNAATDEQCAHYRTVINKFITTEEEPIKGWPVNCGTYTPPTLVSTITYTWHRLLEYFVTCVIAATMLFAAFILASLYQQWSDLFGSLYPGKA